MFFRHNYAQGQTGYMEEKFEYRVYCLYGKSTIKLTGIVKCTDTMCTGILMTACYMLCGQQSVQQVWLQADLSLQTEEAATKSHSFDYSQCNAAIVGFWHFQVWHMQRVIYTIGNTVDECTTLRKTWRKYYKRFNSSYLKSVRYEFSNVIYIYPLNIPEFLEQKLEK